MLTEQTRRPAAPKACSPWPTAADAVALVRGGERTIFVEESLIPVRRCAPARHPRVTPGCISVRARGRESRCSASPRRVRLPTGRGLPRARTTSRRWPSPVLAHRLILAPEARFTGSDGRADRPVKHSNKYPSPCLSNAHACAAGSSSRSGLGVYLAAWVLRPPEPLYPVATGLLARGGGRAGSGSSARRPAFRCSLVVGATASTSRGMTSPVVA